MAGFSNQQNGFITTAKVIGSIIDDMLDHGFTLRFPTVKPQEWTAPFKATLSASSTVDPLASTQGWRVHFNVIDDYQVKMYVASDIQLPDDGTISKLNVDYMSEVDSAGVIGSDLEYPYKLNASTILLPATPVNDSHAITLEDMVRLKRINNADRQFIDRSIRIPDMATSQNYPMSYLLNITPRGFSLCVWEEAQDPTPSKHFSWVVVQRPVDRETGEVLIDTATKCPVFCVYGLQDMYIPAAIQPKDSQSPTSVPKIIYPERWESGIKRFVVREQDVIKPTPSSSAVMDTPDSAAIINAAKQVSITEDNKYVITFPNRLNTYRYSYTHELDLLGYTSASVVAQYSQVPLRVYEEQEDRTYQAMMANGELNTKMRILLLTAGGGI